MTASDEPCKNAPTGAARIATAAADPLPSGRADSASARRQRRAGPGCPPTWSRRPARAAPARQARPIRAAAALSANASARGAPYTASPSATARRWQRRRTTRWPAVATVRRACRRQRAAAMPSNPPTARIAAPHAVRSAVGHREWMALYRLAARREARAAEINGSGSTSLPEPEPQPVASISTDLTG
jgi:hypothetical protein